MVGFRGLGKGGINVLQTSLVIFEGIRLSHARKKAPDPIARNEQSDRDLCSLSSTSNGLCQRTSLLQEDRFIDAIILEIISELFKG